MLKTVLLVSLVSLVSFGCKARSMNDAGAASSSQAPKFLKVYQGQLEEQRLWSGTVVFAGEQKGGCRIVESEKDSIVYLGKNRAISCEWQSRGVTNTFYAMAHHGDAPTEGFARLNDAGFAQFLLNCTYYRYPVDGLLLSCEKSDATNYGTKISIEHASGKYSAKVSQFARGGKSEIKCERKGFDRSDVQNYLECKGNSGNGESDSTYTLELKLVASDRGSELAWGRLTYSGSGGVLSRAMYCDHGDSSYLNCSIDSK